MKFWGFADISCDFLRCKVLSCWETWAATCIDQFNSINHPPFYLWWNENLLNHQKVSKYCKHDCLQNLFFFLSLLTALIVKNSHILGGVYFIFLKISPRPNLKGFQYQRSYWKDRERSYQLKINFSTFFQISCSNFWLKLCQKD